MPAPERSYRKDAFHFPSSASRFLACGIFLALGCAHPSVPPSFPSGILLDAATGGGKILAFAFAGEDRFLVAGDDEGTLRIYDAAGGALLREVLLGERIHSLRPLDSLKAVACGLGNGDIRIVDVATGAVRSTLKGHAGQVLCLDASPDGALLASGSAEYDFIGFDSGSGEIILWNLPDGSLRSRLSGPGARVHSIAFDPSGKFLAAGRAQETVEVWNVAEGRRIAELPAVDPDENRSNISPIVHSVRFSPNGRLLTAGCDYGRVVTWSVPEWKPVSSIQGHLYSTIAVAYSPDGKTLATGGRDRLVWLWEADTGKRRDYLLEHRAEVLGLAFSRNGRILATHADEAGFILWDLKARQPPATPIEERLAADLLSPNEQFRESAAMGLARCGTAASIGPLERATADPYRRVRTMAISALGQIRDPRAVPPLLRILRGSDDDAAEFAVQALGHLRLPETLPALAAALKYPSERVRAMAIDALGNLKDPGSVGLLLETTKDAETTWHWSRALDILGDAAAVGPLFDRLPTLPMEKRTYVVETLRSLTGRDLGEDPAKWEAWWKAEGQAFLEKRRMKAGK